MHFKKGNPVTWMDNYGRGPPYTATIERILVAESVYMTNEYECEQVEMIDSTWAKLNGKEIILITDNDRWLFAWQIEEEKVDKKQEEHEVCVSCQQYLPMSFIGTGWEYTDGQPMCFGCIGKKHEFLTEEQKGEMN